MSNEPFPIQFLAYTSSFGRRGRTGLVQTYGDEWRYQIQPVRFRARVLVAEMNDTERAAFFAFFEARQAAGDSFLFTDPIPGVTYRVRFASDQLDLRADYYQLSSGEIEMIEVDG